MPLNWYFYLCIREVRELVINVLSCVYGIALAPMHRDVYGLAYPTTCTYIASSLISDSYAHNAYTHFLICLACASPG